MASLQQLRKRLRTIRTTGQMAAAMRSAATAKYARVSRERERFAPFAEGCARLLSDMGGAGIVRNTDVVRPRDVLIILGGNRGMCGGFNAEFLRYVQTVLDEPRSEPPYLIVCGKKAQAFLNERGLEAEAFPMSDVPVFDEVYPICRRAMELYVSGEAERVIVLYQSFRNMLSQIPSSVQVLPEAPSGSSSEAGLLYLPDKDTIGDQLAVFCYESGVFHLFLDNASGAQAATLMAMRAACDNAEESAANLELVINRRRQAEVTAGVIETASGNYQQGD